MSCLTGVETTEIVASDVPMFLTLKSKVAVVVLNTSNNLEEASPCPSGGTSFPLASSGMMTNPCLLIMTSR